MKNSLKVTVLAAALAAVMPLQGNAAGLGGINVFSALGQPLRAEIELHANPEELQSMSAAVPSPEAFRRANLDYSPLMTDLEMKVERRGNRSVIRLSSSRVINEPFMDVLVELRWAAGSLLREYTFLLDPAESVTPVAAAPAVAVPPARTAPATTRPAVASGTHVVRRGETMHRIARIYLPAGATLEQMMVALLHENADAFVDGNINRLRAGASLNIPDRQAVSALSPDQARREVLVQKEEFEAYRNRVAGTVAARPPATPTEASRESAGRVEPRVQELVREASPADKVEVSGPTAETAPAPSGDAGVDRRQDATSTPEEDFVALRRELEEMRSRLSELEQVVTDQQEIIAIRDSMIAGLQGQTEGGVIEAEPAAAAAPSSAPAKPAQSLQTPPPASAPVPTTAPGLFDGVMANPVMLGGGAAIIGLLALLGLRVARRKREDGEADSFMPIGEPNDEPLSVVSQPGGESVDTDTSSSVMDTDFSQTGLSAIDADEGVDPVAEADVYLAYGRDAQAEEILLDALKVDASRHAIYLKLLEVYLQRGDRRQFETIATDLYARTGGNGGDWQKAATMGRKVDPENPLYGEGKADTGEASAATALAAAAVANAVHSGGGFLEDTHVGLDRTELQIPGYEDDVSSQGEQVSADGETADLDFDLGDFGQIAADAPVEQFPGPDDDENRLDFEKMGDQFPSLSAEDQSAPVPNLGAEGDGGSDVSGVTGDAAGGRAALDLEKTEFDNSVLDFDLDLSAPSSEQVADSVDVASLPVQGDDSASPEPANGAESDGEPAAVPQFDVQDMQGEMETKLELARAYDEMGDREGARELLEEVVIDGADEQREEARRMLERLS